MVINKVPIKIRPKVKSFLNAVDKHFSFLIKDYGYEFKEAKIATEYVVDNVIEVLYQNEELDRLIIIHYEPIDIDQEEADFITLIIYKGIEFRKNKLEFDLYIEKHNSVYDTSDLNEVNKNNKASFDENMETSVSGYAYFLKDIGINLVNGNEWENGLVYDFKAAEDMLYQAQKDIIYGEKGDDDNDDET